MLAKRFVLTLALSLIAMQAIADDVNTFHVRGRAFKVTLDRQYIGADLLIVESQVFLHEISRGFTQDAWFTCPTGSCINPSNLLGCEAELVTSETRPNGVFETWKCPGGVDGNCLGATGFVNFEGYPLMRPFMETLGIVNDRCTAR